MFNCNICEKEFRTERALSGHKSSHNRDQATYLAGRKKLQIIWQPTTSCNYCGKEFENGKQVGGHKVKCFFNPNRHIVIDRINITKNLRYSQINEVQYIDKT